MSEYSNSFPVFVKDASDGHSKYCSVYVYEEINSPLQFVDVIEETASLKEGDVLYIYLNCRGGCVYSTDSMVHTIKMLQSAGVNVLGVCSGEVMSAATVIALACDDLVISDNTTFLFHAGSVEFSGSFHEIVNRNTMLDITFNSLKNSYVKFFTEEELLEMRNGKEFIMGKEEFITRWKMARGNVDDV